MGSLSFSLPSFVHTSWFYWVVWVAYACTIVGVVGVIVSENRSPVKSLAWITVLLLLPAVGLLLYIFLGRSIKNTSRTTRRLKRRLKRREAVRRLDVNRLDYDRQSMQQVRLAHSLTGAMFYTGNDARYFDSGRDKFRALLQDIAGARTFIHLQYYIFSDDNIGTQVADALIERARHGVKVRVIYDHVGSYGVRKRFFRRMQQAGVEVYPFFKVLFPPFGTRINWRNHRKLVVIDGRVGYIGGMNIADRYITGGKFARWQDLHLRVTGPVVSAINFAFCFDWNSMGHPMPEETILADDAGQEPSGDMGMQVVTGGPTSQWSNISLVMHRAIASARKRVYLMTPYFLPNESLLRALQTSSLAKVDVRIIIPRRSDSDMLRWASASYYKECMMAGVKIYRYNPGMMHSKALLVDDELVTVGSTNFDFRSFEHNFESNIFIYSRRFNEVMLKHFETTMRDSTRLTPHEWNTRPMREKALESVMRLLAPIL